MVPKSKSLTYYFFKHYKGLKVFHSNLFIPAETPVFELNVSVWLSMLNINPAFSDFSLKAAGLVFAHVWTLLSIKRGAYQSQPSNTSKKQTQSPTCRCLTTALGSIDERTLLMTLSVWHADRKVVSTHLPLAWTHSSPLEEQKLVSLLEDLAKMFQPH